MKSKVLVLVTALSSLVLLTACSNLQNGLTATTSSSSVEQSQSSSSESSSQEEKVDISAYDSIISKYQAAVANNQTDASLNFLVVNYANSQTSPASTVYTYRDLDGNGVDELILAFKPGKLFKEHVITDIYTISKDGKTITITSDGQLDFWGYTYPIDKVSPNQYVSGIYTLTYVDSSPVGNTPIQLCPKGVSDASDAGDNSKDRILATNGVPSEESYFYRVD